MAFSTLIEASELQSLLREAAPPILVDCRFSLADAEAGEKSYLASHLPGAHHAHLERQLSGAVTPGVTGRHPLPDATQLRRFFGDLGVTPTRQVVALDEGGPFAARCWWLLRWLGHEKVAVLNGGISAWLEAGGEMTAQPPDTTPAAPYPERAPLCRSMTATDILQGRAGQLVDAREPMRFRGEAEPIDPVAGRLPNAVNKPFTDNFSAPGRYLERAELAQCYADLPANRQLTCYCGSGVTAIPNILAMVHAGLPEPALYVGSFSDWITNPERKVVRG